MKTNLKNLDFVYSLKAYDKDKIERSEFYYNSSNGLLKNNRPEENIIKLSVAEKKEVYELYKKLSIKSNKCWFPKESYSDFSYEYNLQMDNNSTIAKKCDSISNEERIKHAKLYLKIRNILKSTDEYKKIFSTEFEVY